MMPHGKTKTERQRYDPQARGRSVGRCDRDMTQSGRQLPLQMGQKELLPKLHRAIEAYRGVAPTDDILQP